MDGIAEEYRTVANNAGWTDRTGCGRLRFDGGDAVSFLQALLSNDVAGIGRNRGASSAYLTPQGRMIAEVEVYRRAESIIASVAPGLAAPLAARFDQLVFAEDVRVADVSDSIAEVGVIGARAPEIVGAAASIDPPVLAALVEYSQVDFAEGFVARSGDALIPAFRVFIEAAGKDRFIERLRAGGAAPMPIEVSEALRIEAGRPRFGVDMTEETIPLEAGLLERAISATKGCYVGQEIVIRILHRGGGRVAKKLVVLALDPSSAMPPAAGAALMSGDREVGRVTSAAFSPTRGAAIALGYLARETAEIGARVHVGSSSGPVAEVTGFAH